MIEDEEYVSDKQLLRHAFKLARRQTPKTVEQKAVDKIRNARVSASRSTTA